MTSKEVFELDSNDIGDAVGTIQSSPRPIQVARMPTERLAFEYNMRHKNRGIALILNHENFDVPSLKKDPRTSTNLDCNNLTKSFKRLGFEVIVHSDLKLSEILQQVENVARMDHSQNDCLVITILSHGEWDFIYAKDAAYKLDSLWQQFTADNCPSLAGKPKLFFIQACRGDQLDGGILLTKTTETDAESFTSYKIPIHADFLIAYSTIPVARMDHSHNDCLLITILSHGESGYIYAKDVQYKLDSLWQQFTANNCPSLAGKPKLFFIQACQGDQLDGGILLRKTTETDGESSMSYKIPIHADFLIAYSTIPGFYSWRNPVKGSWFVQSLCRELDRNGTKGHILELLTFVCQRVALDFESNTPDSLMMHQQKQIPCITTMLTRLLTFTEK